MTKAARRARRNVAGQTYGPVPLVRRWLPPLSVDELRVPLLMSPQLEDELLTAIAYMLRVDKMRHQNHP
jgi:hypothetical protein